MIKHLFISASILSIFSGNMLFASGVNDSKDKSPKEEQEYVIKETKKVKNEIKTLKETHESLVEIAENKKEIIAKLEEKLSKEEQELKKLKQQVKEEKERIAEEQRLAKIQKEKEEAERLAREKEEAERVAEEEKAKEKQESSNQASTNTTNTNYVPTGAKLTPSAGVFQGPSGKETYYNLDMSGVISIAKSQGIQGEYWIREDGAKMYGDYVIVAAHLGIRPRGSLIQTSLGMGIVLDTGGFASSNSTQLDIATNW